jgi:hypothetical protein
MKGSALRAFAAALLLPSTTSFPARADTTPDERVHTSERFAFTAQAPYTEVFPLFGALQEKAWAPGWIPDFVWPRPATDCAGMVFRIAQEGRVATWVATAFDQAAGRVQYVYVVPDVMVTLITLTVLDRGPTTDVQVQYDRTSLASRADDLVSGMATNDRHAGPEWAEQINAYLARAVRGPHPAGHTMPCQ